jgi:hypothetical protein
MQRRHWNLVSQAEVVAVDFLLARPARELKGYGAAGQQPLLEAVYTKVGKAIEAVVELLAAARCYQGKC